MRYKINYYSGTYLTCESIRLIMVVKQCDNHIFESLVFNMMCVNFGASVSFSQIWNWVWR